MRIVLVTAALVFTLLSFAQSPKLVVGPEYNYYPAGHVIGVQAEFSPHDNHHSFNVRLAYNRTIRWDFSGLNDDERGGGPGGSLGYRYYLTPECRGLYLGLRTDIWFMKVNWQDSSEVIQEGSTEIDVVQPTFELGYLFHFKNGWELGTAFTNGVELNVKMDGKPVGEGWITLWQIRLNKRINLKRED
ncbi:MAG: hypothetical protein COA58_08045 [Bacteroidetes bacterium]|nr:MAG: hypothetical protein COA58_08045 [Bacteroidota bacterium]